MKPTDWGSCRAISRPYGDLRDFWIRGGVAVNPGLDPAVLDAIAGARGIVLSHDLRRYFLTVDGMPVNMWDAGMIRFRPLREVVSVAEEYDIPSCIIPKGLSDPARYLIFADFLIGSHYYAVGSEGEVIWLCTDTFIPIARSFPELIERYLDDPSSILFPPDVSA